MWQLWLIKIYDIIEEGLENEHYFTVKHNLPGSQKSADCPYQA
jgi:hypothetical protein